MSRIAGFYRPGNDGCRVEDGGSPDALGNEEIHSRELLERMRRSMEPEDGSGGAAGKRRLPVYVGSRAGLVLARQKSDGERFDGRPMERESGGQSCAAVCCGELYNAQELRRELRGEGCFFETERDEEVLLAGFLAHGEAFVRRLNGVYGYAVYDERTESLWLFRDRIGAKPLFYTVREDGTVLFASEIKALFAVPGIKPRLSVRGLSEIFGLGPAKIPGSGVFEGIRELKPGCMLCCSRGKVREFCYWKLVSRPHEESYARTVEYTAYLIQDSIRRQLKPDVPVCAFLSGGVDSSLVSAVSARLLREQGETLHTFSFDFEGNEKNFQANEFQPSRDLPYVERMVSHLGTVHHYLECGNESQVRLLRASVDAHDLPAMGDVDASMLYFCSLVADSHRAALTGECADEIFGGYPWFHRKECLEAETFPWTMDLEARKVMLSDDFAEAIGMEDVIGDAYAASVRETPRLDGEPRDAARRRELFWLNQRWFMQTLLDRMERAGAYAGIEGRVPFADYRILEYLWNVPWEMKNRSGVTKGLLRDAGRGLLPEEVLFRKKCPYPKTYDRAYERLLAGQFRELLLDSASPLLPFLDRRKAEQFLERPSDYGRPWYGQLMAGPQMLAYLIQVDYWMRKFHISVEL